SPRGGAPPWMPGTSRAGSSGGSRGRHRRALVLLLLEAPVLRRPEALEIGDHVRDRFVAQLVFEGRHRQLRRLVERVAQAVADDLRELRVAVAPGVAAVV